VTSWQAGSRGAGTQRLPLYQELKERLRRRIEAGELPAHAQLPSTRELTKTEGVSLITVRQALRDLATEGLVYSAPGKGFFVAHLEKPHELLQMVSFTSAMQSRGLRPCSDVLDARTLDAEAALARQLGLSTGDRVHTLTRVRCGDEVPMSLQTVHIPYAAAPKLLDHDWTSASLFEVLQSEFGIRLGRAESSLGARIALSTEISALAMKRPAAVLTVDQLTWDADGRPVEMSSSVHHPDRYRLTIRQG